MTLPSCVRFHRYDLQKLPGNLSDDAVVKPHLQHGVEIRLHDALAEFFEVYDPDLRRFRDHGGKMIAWEGNADTAAGPYALLNYYQKVRDALGGSEKTRDTMRLFILPGSVSLQRRIHAL